MANLFIPSCPICGTDGDGRFIRQFIDRDYYYKCPKCDYTPTKKYGKTPEECCESVKEDAREMLKNAPKTLGLKESAQEPSPDECRSIYERIAHAAGCIGPDAPRQENKQRWKITFNIKGRRGLMACGPDRTIQYTSAAELPHEAFAEAWSKVFVPTEEITSYRVEPL
jgi:hypothetical protein